MAHKKKAKLFLIIILTTLLVSFMSRNLRIPVQAQGSETWTFPRVISGLRDTSPSQYPVFVADGAGSIHVFHSQFVDNVLSIVYSRWQDGIGWTYPIDIVESPRGDARITGAFLDKLGVFHILFWGGDDLAADMYYTRAHLEGISQSTAWQEPRLVGKSAVVPTTAALVGDGEGFLGAVYSGNIDGNGLYFIRSLDGGETWSEPSIIFLTGSDLLWPTALQLSQPGDDQVHAVWSLSDETGNSRAVYYARLESDYEQWSDLVILAEAIEYEADTASIIEYQGQLFVIYHNGFPTTRWMRRSRDSGDTWTQPVRLFEQVGSNGAAALLVDGKNTLHMFFGNRVGEPAIHGLWHSTWLGQVWSKPTMIVSGSQIRIGPNGEEGFDPSYAQAIVNQGNQIFVVWRHDPMAGPKNIWYSSQYLDAPQYTPASFPTHLPTQSLAIATENELPESTPAPLETVPVFSSQTIPVAEDGFSANITLIASMVTVLLTLSIFIAVQRLRK